MWAPVCKQTRLASPRTWYWKLSDLKRRFRTPRSPTRLLVTLVTKRMLHPQRPYGIYCIATKTGRPHNATYSPRRVAHGAPNFAGSRKDRQDPSSRRRPAITVLSDGRPIPPPRVLCTAHSQAFGKLEVKRHNVKRHNQATRESLICLLAAASLVDSPFRGSRR